MPITEAWIEWCMQKGEPNSAVELLDFLQGCRLPRKYQVVMRGINHDIWGNEEREAEMRAWLWWQVLLLCRGSVMKKLHHRRASMEKKEKKERRRESDIKRRESARLKRVSVEGGESVTKRKFTCRLFLRVWVNEFTGIKRD